MWKEGVVVFSRPGVPGHMNRSSLKPETACTQPALPFFMQEASVALLGIASLISSRLGQARSDADR
jgi:hypothetical protein